MGRTPFAPQQDGEKGALGQDTQTRIFHTCSGIVSLFNLNANMISLFLPAALSSKMQCFP